jgi:N utilization substance protein A
MATNAEHAGAVALFMSVLDVSKAEATLLADAGHTTLEELAYVPLNELLEITGFAQARILVLRERAKRCVGCK